VDSFPTPKRCQKRLYLNPRAAIVTRQFLPEHALALTMVSVEQGHLEEKLISKSKKAMGRIRSLLDPRGENGHQLTDCKFDFAM
jgi:hypothetical protein